MSLYNILNTEECENDTSTSVNECNCCGEVSDIMQNDCSCDIDKFYKSILNVDSGTEERENETNESTSTFEVIKISVENKETHGPVSPSKYAIRKMKNKISAKESRTRRALEFHNLGQRVKELEVENELMRTKIKVLENEKLELCISRTGLEGWVYLGSRGGAV